MTDSFTCERCGHPIFRDVRSPKRLWRRFGENTGICPEGGMHNPDLRADWQEWDEVFSEWEAFE